MEAAGIITAVAALVSALAGAFAGVQWGRSAERKAQEIRVRDERTRKPGGGVVISQPGIEVRLDSPVHAAELIDVLRRMAREGR